MLCLHRCFFLPSHFHSILRLIPKRISYLSFHTCEPHDNELLDYFNFLLQRSLTLQQARQIHSQIFITDAHRSPFLASRLVSLYSRFGLVFDARKVFSLVPFDSLQNLLLWNSIIRANVTHGYYEFAVRLYVAMRKLGFWPDGFTLPLVIRACTNVGTNSLCNIVHCHVLEMGFWNHLHVVNELLSMYGKLEKMDHACHLFDGMPVRSVVSWNTMVSGYTLSCDPVGASRIFKRMELEGLQPNSVTCDAYAS